MSEVVVQSIGVATTGEDGNETHKEDGQVVVHVEHRELVPLLAEDDEDRVAEIEDLGQVEHVEHVAHDRVLKAERVARQRRVALLQEGTRYIREIVVHVSALVRQCEKRVRVKARRLTLR